MTSGVTTICERCDKTVPIEGCDSMVDGAYSCPIRRRWLVTTDMMGDDPATVAALEAEISKLRAAIFAAHPTGGDEDPDPVDVVQRLGREWLAMTMAPMPQTVTFLDGETERTAVWDDGDESVGLRGGYATEDEMLETLEAENATLWELCGELAITLHAIRQYVLLAHHDAQNDPRLKAFTKALPGLHLGRMDTVLARVEDAEKARAALKHGKE